MKREFLENELKKLRKKGIRTVVYSFYDIGISENYELYTHGRAMNGDKTRLMVISDDNNIYLLKLRELYGREMYDKIHIDTAYERRNRQ